MQNKGSLKDRCVHQQKQFIVHPWEVRNGTLRPSHIPLLVETCTVGTEDVENGGEKSGKSELERAGHGDGGGVADGVGGARDVAVEHCAAEGE